MNVDRDAVTYLYLPLEGAPVDAPVQVAIASDVDDRVFSDAEWSDDGRVRILFGAAPFDLEPGMYRVWVKFTADPEAPVIPVPDGLSVT